MALLRGTKMRSASIKTRDSASFSAELLSMVWYVLYFGGWCSQQEPAGPGMFDVEAINLISGSVTAEDAIYGDHRHGVFRFGDTAGVCKKTVPCGYLQWFGDGHGAALLEGAS